jgi:hypothetical protein
MLGKSKIKPKANAIIAKTEVEECIFVATAQAEAPHIPLLCALLLNGVYTSSSQWTTLLRKSEDTDGLVEGASELLEQGLRQQFSAEFLTSQRQSVRAFAHPAIPSQGQGRVVATWSSYPFFLCIFNRWSLFQRHI